MLLKEQVVSKLADSSVADWLVKTIDSRLKRGKGRGEIKLEGFSVDPAAIASNALSSGMAPAADSIQQHVVQPPPGLSPGKAQGQNSNRRQSQKPSPKPKAKAKAQANPNGAKSGKSTGRGKGKASIDQSSKGGKGKGKPKGKGKKGKGATW